MTLRSVLIVEPNPGILIVGRNVLARAGLVVGAVTTVEEGLALAGRRPPEVVILDGRVEPDVLLTFARSRPGGVPIVLTIQKGREVSAVQALERRGASRLVEIVEVIEKPFAPERLLNAVEEALRRRPGPEARISARPVALIGEDDPDETERTEEVERTHPFEVLLESVSGRPPERRSSSRRPEPRRDVLPRASSARYARMRARLEAALSEHRVRLDPKQLLAIAEACEAALRDEAPPVEREPGRGDLAIEGRIEHVSIDHILQIAASVAQPACCRLEHRGQSIEIFFRGAQVVFARQDNLPDGFTVGRFLSSAGVVDQLEVDRVSDARSGPTGWIGQRLIMLGHIQEADLARALERQTEELVLEGVRWHQGRFVVHAKDPVPPEGRAASVALPVHHLLLEGMRRLDEWRRMVRDLGDMGSVLDRLDTGNTASVLESLRPEERLLLEHVDGRRTVEDLVRSVRRPTFDVFKSLERLRGRRLVKVLAPPVNA